jgi:predicted metalloprotease
VCGIQIATFKVNSCLNLYFMQWRGRRQSSNVEDRRGVSGRGLAVGGGVGGVIMLVLYLLLGGNPGDMGQVMPNEPAQELSPEQKKVDDERAEFVRVVLADTEDVWNTLLQNQYREPTLVMYRQSVESACGMAGSATGPFYCPGDEKVYIDLSFFDDMERKLNAGGDFAMAYVIAHEVGHHIQRIQGTSEKMARLRQQLSQEDYNKYSVMLELQADFLAGVWAHHTQRDKKVLEANDIDEALNAANAIGDDRLQRQTQGQVVPESFTHGTSEQRMHWFKKGYSSGDIRQGNTFNDPSLQ